MNELIQKSAVELATGIANKSFSASEVADAHLQRIADVNPDLNAVVRVLDDMAHTAAAEVDRAVAAGEPLGPLAGVPVTIKENIDVAGLPTTQGLVALADAVPSSNSPIVDRILAAGAVPVGRTNLPEMGLRLHTDNALHGPTINPWSAGHTTGGSSGGEGVALATGMSALGLGNDVGGSLRNPATCCGIASIKPTQGVVPHAVTIPFEDEPISFQQMLTDGPMARTVADVRRGLDVMRGYHPRDPNSVNAEQNVAAGPLRIAVMSEPSGGSVDARIAALTCEAASALEAAGCIVTEAEPPQFSETIELWFDLLDNDFSLVMPLVSNLMSEDPMKFLEDFRTGRSAPSTEDYASTLTRRMFFARSWANFYSDYDILLSPTWTQLPYPVGWDIEQPGRAIETMTQARCVLPGNALGLPSACVPAGIEDGLPVGVMLTGARFSDYLCLDAAAVIEKALGNAIPINPAG